MFLDDPARFLNIMKVLKDIFIRDDKTKDDSRMRSLKRKRLRPLGG